MQRNAVMKAASGYELNKMNDYIRQRNKYKTVITTYFIENISVNRPGAQIQVTCNRRLAKFNNNNNNNIVHRQARRIMDKNNTSKEYEKSNKRNIGTMWSNKGLYEWIIINNKWCNNIARRLNNNPSLLTIWEKRNISNYKWKLPYDVWRRQSISNLELQTWRVIRRTSTQLTLTSLSSFTQWQSANWHWPSAILSKLLH